MQLHMSTLLAKIFEKFQKNFSATEKTAPGGAA